MRTPEWMTVNEVAEHLGVHPETVRRWLRQGHLEGIRAKNRQDGWSIRPESVDKMLDAWIARIAAKKTGRPNDPGGAR